MFNSYFPFVCVGYTRSADPTYILGIKHYSFKTPKYRYLVEVEHYIKNIYIIQYYRAKDRKNPKKYSLLSNEHQCLKIVGTCIRIMQDILLKDENATFGFIGSNTYYPDTKTEEPISETKRWKIYSHAVENHMGTETFSHAWLPLLSRYVMINKKTDKEMMLNDISMIFSKMYDKEESTQEIDGLA